LPFIYVRSEAKSHGMGNQIEGDLSVLSNVVIIEDLVSTGKSSLLAVKALEAAGIDVKGLIAIFTYGFDEAYAAFEQAGCKWEALTDYPTLLEQAAAEGYIADAQREVLSAWSADAKGWSEAHLAKSASA